MSKYNICVPWASLGIRFHFEYASQLWKRVEAHVRAKMDETEKAAERVSVNTRKGFERRLMEVKTIQTSIFEGKQRVDFGEVEKPLH